MMEARGNSRHLESLTNAFRPLERRKAAKDLDTPYRGRYLGNMESVSIIWFTDGHTRERVSELQSALAGPMFREPWRWDHRLYMLLITRQQRTPIEGDLVQLMSRIGGRQE